MTITHSLSIHYEPIFYFLVAIISLNVTTVGPCTHLYIAEILPEKGLALSYAVFYASKVVLTMTFKPITNSLLGFSGLFFVYAGCSLTVLVLIMVLLKETHGRTLVQIEELYD